MTEALSARTWPVHDEPGCVFCAGPPHRPVNWLAGIPIIACPALPDKEQIVVVIE